MRIVALTAVLAVALAGATGAGARSPKDPTLRTKPADVRLARTLLVTRADLPAGIAFVDKGIDKSSNADFQCKGVQEPDLHRLVETAEIDGHTFEAKSAAGFTQVQSSASIFRSAREAAVAVGALRSLSSAAAKRCFAAAIRKGLPGGTSISQFRFKPLRRTVGGLKLLVWEISLQVQAGGRALPMDLVMAFYERGRAVPMLMLMNAGTGVDPTLARSLSAGMVAKLETARL